MNEHGSERFRQRSVVERLLWFGVLWLAGVGVLVLVTVLLRVAMSHVR